MTDNKQLKDLIQQGVSYLQEVVTRLETFQIPNLWPVIFHCSL